MFLRHLAQTSDQPMMVEVEHADGIYLFGPDGKRYLDMISGIAVSALGHNHPSVVRAVKAQAEKHLHVMVYGEFIQAPQVLLAKKLTGLLPPALDQVFFVNSGSEATEGALKLAKRATGRHRIVAAKDAYHGSSHGALSLCNSESFTQAFRPLLPGIAHIEFGRPDDLQLVDEETAAVIIETVQGEAGVRIADQQYFKSLRKRCDETGALLILDEIQCGFGRTGRFWAFEHYGIVPDILLTAKAMGGGMPIGAFIAGKPIMSCLMSDPVLGHITTFGGHPVSAAASVATVDTIIGDHLHAKAAEKGAQLRALISHPAILEVRHIGLMMALQFDAYETVSRIIKRTTENGLISDWFLFCDTAIRIAPPLTITSEEIEAAADVLNRSIDEAISS
jgi:acetylornithine/succinyldiaminopimelate/putrescine aminotransferase